MIQVNVHEAKTHLSKFLDMAHAGEEIILAKAGKPYARLLPLKEQEDRQPGRYRENVPESFFHELPEEELQGWNS
jgi:prevent-host-death family protein